MSKKSLVSVICLCHNQAQFVGEAIQSVLDQDYPSVELIVVDDASTDNSKNEIKEAIEGASIPFISLTENVGNCAAFNLGFEISKGQFIIDLAGDDLLHPNRISKGIKAFEDYDVGVDFCDVELLDESGKFLGTHYKRDEIGNLTEEVPQGEIYRDLIKRYFISPPSMMIRRKVLEMLGGYDEQLTYEDFDFWIRSSRHWNYAFTDQILVKKRILKDSFSSEQFQLLSKHQKSTLKVCRKIKKLNKTVLEDLALQQRCWYEIRQCAKQGNFGLIPAFFNLTL